MRDSFHLIDLTKFKFLSVSSKLDEFCSKSWLNKREND